MRERILAEIRKRSREQWLTLARSSWDEVRQWMAEHGELAALCGLLLGVFVVTAFKFFLTFVVVVAVVALVIWQIALPEQK